MCPNAVAAGDTQMRGHHRDPRPDVRSLVTSGAKLGNPRPPFPKTDVNITTALTHLSHMGN